MAKGKQKFLDRSTEELLLLSANSLARLASTASEEIDSPKTWRLRVAIRDHFSGELDNLSAFLCTADTPTDAKADAERDRLARLEEQWQAGECRLRDTHWKLPWPSDPLLADTYALCRPLLHLAAVDAEQAALRLGQCDPGTLVISLCSHLVHLTAPLLQQCIAVERRLLLFSDQGLGSGHNDNSPFDCRNARRNFFSKYPVLWRLASARTNNATRFAISLIGNLKADLEELHNTFGLPSPPFLHKVQWGSGDLHNGGKSVCVLTFGEKQLVYKPRCLAPELLVNAIATLTATSTPSQTPTILDKGEYGYVAFVAHEPAVAAQRPETFYYQIGQLLSISWLLGLTDIHYENIIATRTGPVVIDCEAVLDPVLNQSTVGGWWLRLYQQALSFALFKTNLLPMRVQVGEKSIDLSGIGAVGPQPAPRQRISVHISKEGSIQVSRERAEFIATSNNIGTAQHLSPVHFLDDIVAGWLSGIEMLSVNRSAAMNALHQFADESMGTVRWVARETMLYASMLESMVHPSLASDIHAADAYLLAALSHKRTEPLLTYVNDERYALWDGDIPYFKYYPTETSLVSAPHNHIFETSGYGAAATRFSRLEEADIVGISAIRMAVGSLAAEQGSMSGHTVRSSFVSCSRALSEALKLAREIDTAAFEIEDKPFWLGLSAVDDTSYRSGIVSPTIYEGVAGIGIFLHHVQEVTGEECFSARIGQIIDLLQHVLDDDATNWPCGGFDGYSGILYALSVLQARERRTPDTVDIRHIGKLRNLIVEDQAFDIVSGAAGALLTLCRLASLEQNLPIRDEILGAGRLAAERLAEGAIRSDGGAYWHTLKTHPAGLGGFAHGVSGIAYALAAWVDISGDASSAALAEEAFTYELSLLDPGGRGWLDGRRNDVTTFWCYGAPGTFLAAQKLYEVLGDTRYRDAMNLAERFTRSTPLADNDCLCHGNLGNAQAICEFDDPFFQNVISNAVAYKRANGCYRLGTPLNTQIPGLMTGLAGIGCSLLQYGAEARILNPLTLAI